MSLLDRYSNLILRCLSLRAAGSSAFGHADVSVDDIYERATARRELIKSCRVVYTVTTRQLAKLPADAASVVNVAPQPYRIHFCFEGERRRMLREPLVPVTATELGSYKEVNPLSELTVFDGNMSVSYFETSIANVTKGKHARADEDEQYCEAALGIPISDKQKATYENAWFYPYCLRNAVGKRPDYFVNHARMMIDGASTIVVEAKGFDKLWVDPQLNYAYRRRERYHSPEHPHLVYRDTLRSFVEVQSGLWVPRSVIREVFAPLNNPREYWNKPYLEIRLDVAEVAINDVTDADFRVDLPARTFVINDSDNNVYQIPGRGFDVLADLADKGQAYLVVGSNAYAGTVWWRKRNVLIALTIVSLLALAFFIGFRLLN